MRDGDRLPARSHQRSSFEIPEPGPTELVRAPAPSQELLDRLAEADLDHRWAETRKVDADVGLVEDHRKHRRAETRGLEAKTAAEARKADAEISLIETQQEKVAGEVAQQAQEERECEVRIQRDEASILKDLTWTVVPLVFIAVGLVIGSIDASHLAGHGYDLVGDKSWLLPSLTGR